MSIGIRPVFEQWALEQGWDIGRADDNSYRTQTTDAAWGGWVAANAPTPNTSPALERVIAQQQAEIDLLKSTIEQNNRYLEINFRERDKFKDSAFTLINHPTNPEARMGLQLALRDQGWCLTCETMPCECDHD